MKTQIYPVKLGIQTSFIIKGDGVILIDGGPPGKLKKFRRSLAKIGISPEEISLIVLTHGHWDHTGSVRDIKKATGAEILMHSAEKNWLEKSIKILPPGVTIAGKIFIKGVSLMLPFIDVPATKVDIIFDDEFSLNEYGIPGKVIHTPGHSPGSSSVLLDSGEVFVGDMAMNTLPLRLSPNLPALAGNMDDVVKSWKNLLENGAGTVYPAHGKAFSADIIRKKIQNI